MILNKKVIKMESHNIEFSGATLLSVDEASSLLNEQERKYKYPWWLRTPWISSDDACIVGRNGYVFLDGDDVSISYGIRPALIISNLGDFKVGDYFSIGEYEFKIISPELAWLYQQDVGEGSFDTTSNDYNTSHIKVVIDSWYEKLLKGDL